MPRWKDYRTLWRLARRRFQSGEDYRRFQEFQGTLLMAYFQSKGLEFRGRRVLDVGCGWGGYTRLFAGAGADVVAVDIERSESVEGQGGLMPGGPWKLVIGNALSLPFPAEQFDFIFCASLIEHVPQPGCLLAELYRVLRPGGQCYLGFPPFYSPAGGHQFKPFHLLGERVATALVRRGGRTFANAGGSWGLYRLTVRRAKQHIVEAGFLIEDISTKFTALNLARIPWLNEVLTWYVQFLVRKEGT